MQDSPHYRMAYIWTIALTAALGGLLFGYDWVVIGGAKPYFERYFELTHASQKGWANSCALVGCLIGAMLSGALSDRFGRKRLLIAAAALFAVTSIGNGLANSFPAFWSWRILGGVAIGLASNLSPMYIAEIAPAAMRGRLVSVNQLTIVVGILLAQIVNFLIAEPILPGTSEEVIRQSWNATDGWRWMFAATAAPSVLFFVSMFFVPESPRWLAKNSQVEASRAVLARLGGAAYADAAIGEIEATLVNETRQVDFRELFNPHLLKILMLGVAIAVFQQWCGINVIFNYAEEVFKEAGYSVGELHFQIIITGSVNLAFTFLAMLTVDRLGRRPLMLVGAAGLAVIYTVLGTMFHQEIKGWYVAGLVVAAIACYACTLAPVTWVVISEIFPNRIRGAAMSVSVVALWAACFVLTYTFPILKDELGADRTFWLYAGICAVGLVFLIARLPETKGRSLEELERELT